ncbi:MAG: hypothetical protein SCARUB_02666 [Candidatus Scalindua rubra]|uniref:DUF433 domain-containing protein n=1 Tax=Candidatus Scalindua rubra TaxID=1872076 RepID=A0A1E3X9D0_9BACT|nr:MAG: hypothetical protein SCARUB_02666 [Candidatus Scalindua rubra]
MTTKTLDGHIEITKGIAGGKPRIAGHRITVQNIVVWHELLGRRADEIAAEYDMTLSDVYAALVYYYDHRTEIDKSIEESESFVKALQQKTPSKVSQKLNEQKA